MFISTLRVVPSKSEICFTTRASNLRTFATASIAGLRLRQLDSTETVLAYPCGSKTMAPSSNRQAPCFSTSPRSTRYSLPVPRRPMSAHGTSKLNTSGRIRMDGALASLKMPQHRRKSSRRSPSKATSWRPSTSNGPTGGPTPPEPQ